ncbi:MAG: succinate dehydrogenase cytochrome b subunit [Apibacter sp.]|jgi:succinate dehydrogenase / fumarate reductase, cytochrome b subunit|uniref:Succinate dehydrogenase / fumarate reductase cytochrome b subunit n=1 Tax=Apibacter mensalis TaxID=1586267 RepID=A0A0X3ANR7_9FLAO|nr:succinate dehydrogenase cytochrome b subunit [Apibacter mensalis]MCO6564219.1 succinate dehydrogenase cytochrome b subunit [Apibacter sp.]CVK16789.1 succinate dehydrogenase / fumarate reductase cytochrome b subunit [Apibacter mensalis]
MTRFYSSSIGRKFMMALTGFFLMIFLLVHLGINLTLFAGNTDCEGKLLPKEEVIFNQASHFMATNPLIQIMQYVLAFGFIYHIFLGIVLTFKNQKARGKERYAVNQFSANTPFNSRTMIYTGLLILIFLLLHLYNYFVPLKFGTVGDEYLLVTELFKSPVYTLLYVLAFIFLGLHLSHGFASSFQSVGFNHKIYTPIIKILGKTYFIFIAVGFAAIAIYFYFKGNGLI